MCHFVRLIWIKAYQFLLTARGWPHYATRLRIFSVSYRRWTKLCDSRKHSGSITCLLLELWTSFYDIRYTRRNSSCLAGGILLVGMKHLPGADGHTSVAWAPALLSYKPCIPCSTSALEVWVVQLTACLWSPLLGESVIMQLLPIGTSCQGPSVTSCLLCNGLNFNECSTQIILVDQEA